MEIDTLVSGSPSFNEDAALHIINAALGAKDVHVFDQEKDFAALRPRTDIPSGDMSSVAVRLCDLEAETKGNSSVRTAETNKMGLCFSMPRPTPSADASASEKAIWRLDLSALCVELRSVVVRTLDRDGSALVCSRIQETVDQYSIPCIQLTIHTIKLSQEALERERKYDQEMLRLEGERLLKGWISQKDDRSGYADTVKMRVRRIVSHEFEADPLKYVTFVLPVDKDQPIEIEKIILPEKRERVESAGDIQESKDVDKRPKTDDNNERGD